MRRSSGCRRRAAGDPDPDHFRRIAVEPVPERTAILVDRGTRPNRYWDDPVNIVARDEASLRFVSFFDWDELALRDYRYAMVRIVDWAAHPHLAGRFALLESSSVRFVLIEGQPEA
jgi:hypothetical protein